MAEALVVDQLTKVYRSNGDTIRALDGVSVSLAPGEVVALLGNNGAGKSTFLDIVAGIIPADSGRVTIFGQQSDRRAGRGEELGYAPQVEAVYPTLTVDQNLRYFGRLCGLQKKALSNRVDDVARQLSIADLMDRRASTLSGGQRRRLHIALALLHRPPLLMLDEPTVGLDVRARDELLDFVRRTAAAGAAIVYSTHQLREVEVLEARTLLIDHGRVLAHGPVTELISRHAPPTAVLRFDRSDPPLPVDFMSAVDEAGWTLAGEYRMVVRLPSAGVRVSEIVDRLEEGARRSLTSATVRAPDLEQAYHRLLRGAGAFEPDTAGDERWDGVTVPEVDADTDVAPSER